MTGLPPELNGSSRGSRLATNTWVQPLATQSRALEDFTAATLGMDSAPQTHDVTD